MLDGHDPPAKGAHDAIHLTLPNLYRTIQILMSPSMMLGQTYVHGQWSVQPERLYDFLYLIRSQEDSQLQKWFLLTNSLHPFRDAFKQHFFPVRSTRAVVEHYNVNPLFMSLILGPSLSYTCAFFDSPDASLEEAQSRKLELIAQRASLQKGHAVLELGSGWGASAFPLAEHYQCNVTGITLSKAQVDFCDERKRASQAAERLEFVQADYAGYQPPSQFDRIISAGMLEHVGKFQYRAFFDKVANFLKDDGIALIHSMVEEQETSPDGWIDKNIFPGGYIPTISEVASGIERSHCRLLRLFTHDKANYFRTLECWKSNLFKNRTQCEGVLRNQGLNATDISTIINIWEYFLSCSQIAFSEKYGRCRVAHFIVRRK